MKRSMLVLAIVACAAIASPSTTSARLIDLTETDKFNQIMRSTIMDPTVDTFAEFIGEPTDVLIMEDTTADIAIISLIPTADIILTPMEDIVRTIPVLIVGMCDGFIVVHIEGAITDAMWVGTEC